VRNRTSASIFALGTLCFAQCKCLLMSHSCEISYLHWNIAFWGAGHVIASERSRNCNALSRNIPPRVILQMWTNIFHFPRQFVFSCYTMPVQHDWRGKWKKIVHVCNSNAGADIPIKRFAVTWAFGGNHMACFPECSIPAWSNLYFK